LSLSPLEATASVRPGQGGSRKFRLRSSIRPERFGRYDVAGLPRTDNDLEQFYACGVAIFSRKGSWSSSY